MALLARSAPLPECSGKTGQVMASPEFTKTLDGCNILVKKVLDNIRGVHDSYVSSQAFSLDSSTENLQYLSSTLAIPSPPALMALSADFNMELCLSRMSEGLELYQDLLGSIRDRVSDSKRVSALLKDVSDLLALVLKMSELAELQQGAQHVAVGLSARLTEGYKVQVAVHVTLVELRAFYQNIFRSLRNIERTKPAARC